MEDFFLNGVMLKYKDLCDIVNKGFKEIEDIDALTNEEKKEL